MRAFARNVLVEPGDPAAWRTPDRPHIRRNVARQDLEEAGLAGAVAADERDPLPWLDEQVRPLEQRQVAECEAD